MDIKKATIAFGLMAAVYAGATKYEAESATLADGAAKSGTYVDLNQGSITFDNVSVDAAGKYTLVIHCAGAYGEKDNNIVVNGAAAGSFHVDEGTDYVDISTSVTLKSGTNTVAITSSWGWIKVDYIEINPFESTAFSISTAPVTPGATESAVKLYNFLRENFGKKTISGIMTGDMESYTLNADFKTHPDVADIYTRSGKYPALVGVDFLFATGPKASESWYKEYTAKGVSLAKDLWNKGGIPAFSWHWKDPLDQKDAFYIQSAAGSNEYTDFDFKTAFKSGTTEWDTESAAYKGIIADIDHIAEYFLELQEAGVAAIFRPLHEAGGLWFWWSINSGNEFAALYRLVFDRMVKEKGVKNLIWVYNPESKAVSEWDPGEGYYDVISIDIYNNDNDHSSNSGAFDTYKAATNSKKLIALTENGPIPDVNNMHTDEAVWSWWMPWYSTWSGKWPGQTANSVWKSNMEDERIITIDDMPGWDTYTPPASITARANNSASMLLKGNSLSLSMPKSGTVTVEVFDLQGNRMATLYRGTISVGTHQFNLAGMARGSYIVRARGAGIAATKQIIVR
jgi:hypothetical protein